VIDIVLGFLGELLYAFWMTWPEGKIARIVSVILHLLVAIFLGLCVGALVTRSHGEVAAQLAAICGALTYGMLVGWWIYRRTKEVG